MVQPKIKSKRANKAAARTRTKTTHRHRKRYPRITPSDYFEFTEELHSKIQANLGEFFQTVDEIYNRLVPPKEKTPCTSAGTKYQDTLLWLNDAACGDIALDFTPKDPLMRKKDGEIYEFWKSCNEKISDIISFYETIVNYRSEINKLAPEEWLSRPEKELEHIFNEYQKIMGSISQLQHQWCAHDEHSTLTTHLPSGDQKWHRLLTPPSSTGGIWDLESYQHADFHLMNEFHKLLLKLTSLPVPADFVPETEAQNPSSVDSSTDCKL
jgi:hypothetical protein